MKKRCVWCGKVGTKERSLELVLDDFIHREPCLREADIENQDGEYYEQYLKEKQTANPHH